MEPSMISEQMTTVRLSIFPTIKTEWLLNYLALILLYSKSFDVNSQQLCFIGPEANQKPGLLMFWPRYCEVFDLSDMIIILRSVNAKNELKVHFASDSDVSMDLWAQFCPDLTWI